MAVQTYQKAADIKLSKNFSSREFRCGLGRGCNCTTTLIDDQLLYYVQAVADFFGVRVFVTSGYRCEKYNRSINGAAGSRHTKGQAADIVAEGIAPRRVAAFLESIGCKGIGLYEASDCGDDFVHCDSRPTKSFWYGHKQAPRSTFGGAAAAGKGATGSTAPVQGADKYTLAQFIREVQKVTGAAVDGIAGPSTLAHTVTISKSKNRRHAVVQAVQKRLRALGYAKVGTADGVAGNMFDEALKAFQHDHGCIEDGEATKGAETWQHLLGMR